MALSIVERQKLKNTVEQVLHAPGNYRGGILEMAVVVDYRLSFDDVRETTKEIVSILKNHSEVFRNVRFHLVHWKSDTEIVKELSSMAMILTESAWEKYEVNDKEKYIDELTRQLKLFHARSKLILLITDRKPDIKDEQTVKNNLQPFLRRKLIYVINEEEGCKIYKNLV